MTHGEVLTLLNKAEISRATGGQLSKEQAKKFIDSVVAENEFLNKIQVVQMTSGTYELSAVEVGSRITRKAAEGVAPTETNGITFKPRQLSSVEIIQPYDITFSFLEENVEGGNMEGKLNSMFAKQFGNDNLDLAINGNEDLPATITDGDSDDLDDTTGLSQGDHDFLRANNGWLKIARADSDVHSYELPTDMTADAYWQTVFNNMLKLLPNKWKTNKSELVFLVSNDIEQQYRDELAARQTALGDAFLSSDKKANYQGITVEPVPFMPGGTTPSVVLTKHKNLAVGIGRSMRVGRQVQERRRIVEYTITAKTDYNYVVSDMLVLGEKA